MQPIVLDFETHLILPGRLAPKPVCLAIDANGDELLHCRFDRQACLDRLERALAAPLLVGANVPYDLAVAAIDFPELWESIWVTFDRFSVWCIQQAEKLIDLADGRLRWHRGPEGMVKVGYSLAEIVRRRFGRGMDKDTWRLRYGTLYDLPLDRWEPGAREYPLGDLRETRAVLQAQLHEPAEKLVDVARQTRAAWWIHLMTCRGFLVERAWTLKLEADIRAEMEGIAKRLRDAGLVKSDGTRDTKAAGTYLEHVLATKGLAPARTPDGKIELTEEACTDTGDALLVDYSRFSSRVTMLAKVETLKDAALAGRPIQSRFEVVLESGRTSCSGGRARKVDPNRLAYEFQLQNPPREPGLRECFVAREGYVLASHDYGQLELCTVAQVCMDLFGYSRLGEALNAGQDVHCLLGARLFGHTYEWVVANRKKDPKAADARQGAKPLNFGAWGGMGPGGIVAYAKTQYGVVFTRIAAEGHLAAWKELWPESNDYFRYIRKCIGSEFGSIGTIVQIRSGRVRGGAGYTDSANSLFQGLAADAAKAAGYECARACYTGRDSAGRRYPALHGSFIVNFVHDELIFEHPEDRASEAAKEAASIMERVAAEWCPAVPPKVEPALMRRWYKAAEPVYRDGRLIPWTPKEKT